MEIDAQSLDAAQAYRLMMGVVVPRPIAWITSLDSSGRINAAPFSCYTCVCKSPPMVAVNIGRKEGVLKDTAHNVRTSGEFVLNVVTVEAAELMHNTSTEYPPEVSEVEELGLEVLPSRIVKPPRLAASPINLECRLHQFLELGDYNDGLLIGEVVHFHINDDLIDDGKISTPALNPLARLGGPTYATLGDYITMAFSSSFADREEEKKRQAAGGS